MGRIIAYVLLVVAVGGLSFGYYEYQLSHTAKAEAQTVRCADLIKNGPGDNGHVIVTDFDFDENFVVEGATKDEKTWKKAYLPMIAAEQALDPNLGTGGRGFRLILETSSATDDAKIKTLEGQKQIEGTIVSSIKSLDTKTQDMLREHYPATDFGSVMILEHDRKPKSPLLWGTCLVVGGLSAAALIGLIIMGLIPKRKA